MSELAPGLPLCRLRVQWAAASTIRSATILPDPVPPAGLAEGGLGGDVADVVGHVLQHAEDELRGLVDHVLDSRFMAGHPGLAPDTVTVLWCAADADERQRAHALLVGAAAELLGVVPSALRVDHEPAGRPVLGGAGQGLRVSVSHGRGVIAVALGRSVAVGVDVEAVRPLRAAALARRWFHPQEADWVAALPQDQRNTAYLWLWTQKEAVGKSLGSGLRDGGMSRRMALPAFGLPGDALSGRRPSERRLTVSGRPVSDPSVGGFSVSEPSVGEPSADRPSADGPSGGGPAGGPVLAPLPDDPLTAAGAVVLDGGAVVLGVAAHGIGGGGVRVDLRHRG
ncbi:4'-phosphopantetheinyl transferase family protein [Peterkaempfera sp. SMS 1(5)a]|uniref:4'-phosphopantetheinyl transferase family protein n=1 Tax=Peterkaempfera podocarpi TaxID=3232308 RepID=UPI00366A5B09